MIDLTKLAAPFPPEKIDWRVGSTTGDKKKGMALAYIDARLVMERLDEVCGPAGWQCRYTHADAKTICEIGINIPMCDAKDEDHGPACFEWVWKADGAGDTDFEGEKGALSSAFKRAAVRWGIGRYLYDVAAPWVEIEARGKSFSIKQSEHAKLRAALGGKPASKPEGNGAAAETKSYEIKPTKGWETWDQVMQRAIDKSASIEMLTKLQMDNAAHLKAYADKFETAQQALMQKFVTRMGNLSQGPVA